MSNSRRSMARISERRTQFSRRRTLYAFAALAGTASGCLEDDRLESRPARVVARARLIDAPPSDAPLVDSGRDAFADREPLRDALDAVVHPDRELPRRYEEDEYVDLYRSVYDGTTVAWLEVEWPAWDAQALRELPRADVEGNGRFEAVYVHHDGEYVLFEYRVTYTTP